MDNNGKTDEIDLKILELLKNDARLSYTEIGEEIGMSRVAVKSRISAMEESGIIKGYKTIIDETASAKGVPFYMEIETEPDVYTETIRRLNKDSHIRKVYSTTGECKLLVIGYGASMPEIANFSRELFCSIRKFKKLTWEIITDIYKDSAKDISYIPGN